MKGLKIIFNYAGADNVFLGRLQMLVWQKIYAAEEGMKRVFSIDAGRKYFQKNNFTNY